MGKKSQNDTWPTSTTQEIEHPNAELTATGRRKSKDGKSSHSLNLADQVNMWPTPSVSCVEGGEQSERVEKTKSGGYILRKKNKQNMTYGAKLSDAILYEEKPTPKEFDKAALNPDWVDGLLVAAAV